MALVTREMINQYNENVTGGNVPSGLFIRNVENFIDQVKRTDTPMLDLVKPKGTRNYVIWEYGEADLAPRVDTQVGGATNNATTIDVAHGEYFQKYDLVRNRRTKEQFLVTAITADALTVIRDWPGQSGTGVAMTGDDILDILGPAVPEGVDGPRSPVARGSVKETYPQILEYTWQMSHRGRHSANYQHQGDQFKYELKRKMKEAAEDLDSLLLNGKKFKGSMSANQPSTMGGLREATTANTASVSGPLEFQDLLMLMQQAAQEVGHGDLGKTVMGNYFSKRVWNSWFQASRRGTLKDGKFRTHWDEVDTDFGVVKFVINYKMDNDELIFWNPEDSGLYNFKNGKWATGLYSTQGWYDTGFLRGDYGAIFEADRRRGRLYGFSTSEADYDYLDLPAQYAITVEESS